MRRSMMTAGAGGGGGVPSGWIESQSMATSLHGVQLADGRVFGVTAPGAASIYTLSGSTYTSVAVASPPSNQSSFSAVLLPDGRVLITGGWFNNSTPYVSACTFATISGNTVTYAAGTAMPTVLAAHAIGLLPDGRVIIAGGLTAALGAAVATVRIGTITGNTIAWATATAMPVAGQGGTLQVRANGQVMIAAMAEIFETSGGTLTGTISGNTISWAVGTPIPIPQMGGESFLIDDKMYYISGRDSFTASGSFPAYLGTPATGWTASTGLEAGDFASGAIPAIVGSTRYIVAAANQADAYALMVST